MQTLCITVILGIIFLYTFMFFTNSITPSPYSFALNTLNNYREIETREEEAREEKKRMIAMHAMSVRKSHLNSRDNMRNTRVCKEGGSNERSRGYHHNCPSTHQCIH